MIILEIQPVAKPRMTIGDRAGHRPVVQRYWQYKNDLQMLAAAQNVVIEAELSVTFILKMPLSWSEGKKRNHFMKPHQQKRRNDLDNLVKALKDCLCVDDSYVWRYKDICKLWGYEGSIEFP